MTRVMVDGKALDKVVKDKGITYNSLADKMGVSSQALRVWRKNGFTPAMFKFLVQILGVKEDDILPGKEKMEGTDAKDVVGYLKEIDRSLKEMCKSLNLVKIDVATLRFAGEERDKKLDFINKNICEIIEMFEPKGGTK